MSEAEAAVLSKASWLPEVLQAVFHRGHTHVSDLKDGIPPHRLELADSTLHDLWRPRQTVLRKVADRDEPPPLVAINAVLATKPEPHITRPFATYREASRGATGAALPIPPARVRTSWNNRPL